jgi:hypothetical protein
MWFKPLEFLFPAMLLVASTFLVGGIFLALAWAQINADWTNITAGRPRKAFASFAFSVILGTASVFVLPLFSLGDLGILLGMSVLAASFVLLFIAVVLSRQSRGMIKIGSRVLFVINLPLFIMLIDGLRNK